MQPDLTPWGDRKGRARGDLERCSNPIRRHDERRGDAPSDRSLAIVRHFAEAIASAARKNVPLKDRGRFVSAIRNLTRAELELGPWRRAA
jgi:hypothetical protein